MSKNIATANDADHAALPFAPTAVRGITFPRPIGHPSAIYPKAANCQANDRDDAGRQRAPTGVMRKRNAGPLPFGQRLE